MGSFTRQGRHGRSLDPESEAFTPTPRTVQWMLSVDCPLSCAHCLSAADEGPPLEPMPLRAAGRLVEQVAELGVGELLLTGGEPLAHPRRHRRHRRREPLPPAGTSAIIASI